MADKTVFANIDMRNSKYQGATKNGQPSGLGFLFNLDHLLALGSWKNEEINRSIIIVYPNRNLLYGQVTNRKL